MLNALLEMGRAYDVAHLGLSLGPCTLLPVLPDAHSAMTHQFQTHLSGERKNIIYIFSNTALFIYAKI
jgi:hypothetical protein